MDPKQKKKMDELINLGFSFDNHAGILMTPRGKIIYNIAHDAFTIPTTMLLGIKEVKQLIKLLQK